MYYLHLIRKQNKLTSMHHIIPNKCCDDIRDKIIRACLHKSIAIFIKSTLCTKCLPTFNLVHLSSFVLLSCIWTNLLKEYTSCYFYIVNMNTINFDISFSFLVCNDYRWIKIIHYQNQVMICIFNAFATIDIHYWSFPVVFYPYHLYLRTSNYFLYFEEQVP